MNDIKEKYLNGEMTFDHSETQDVFDAWEEQKHPRGKGGQFSKKGESASGGSDGFKVGDKVADKNDPSQMYEILEDRGIMGGVTGNKHYYLVKNLKNDNNQMIPKDAFAPKKRVIAGKEVFSATGKTANAEQIAHAKKDLEGIDKELSKREGSGAIVKFRIKKLDGLGKWSVEPNLSKFGENQKENLARIEKERKLFDTEAEAKAYLAKVESGTSGELKRSDISVSSLKDGVATAFAPEGVNVDQDVRKKMIAAVMEKHPGKKFTFSKAKNGGIEGVKAVEIKGEGDDKIDNGYLEKIKKFPSFKNLPNDVILNAIRKAKKNNPSEFSGIHLIENGRNWSNTLFLVAKNIGDKKTAKSVIDDLL